MSRTRRRSCRNTHPTQVDVMTQMEAAWSHKGAALTGGLLGGAVPWFGRTLAHNELGGSWWHVGLVLTVVLGCAAFSALTVHKFGQAAFGDDRKALGFVLALEGVMLVTTGATSAWALVLLVMINAIANGCHLALGREATVRRREADARRSRTRAHNRSGNRTAPQPSTVPCQPASSPGRWEFSKKRLTDGAIDAEIVSEYRFS